MLSLDSAGHDFKMLSECGGLTGCMVFKKLRPRGRMESLRVLPGGSYSNAMKRIENRPCLTVTCLSCHVFNHLLIVEP
jgi:hypothetical protein